MLLKVNNIGKIPRPFLKMAIQGCINWANENNVTSIGVEEMNKINEQRKRRR